MPKLSTEISHELAREIERIVRDGWFPDQDTVIKEALTSFIHTRTFLGDSPRMLHRFAADALNDSKPEVALKFADRAVSLLGGDKMSDLGLYQSIVELRVQILMVLGRDADALSALEEAHEKLPNNPSIQKWIERLSRNKPSDSAVSA